MSCKKKKIKSQLKRKDILICPFFRMSQWEYKKGKSIIDMYCSLDGMIFFSQHIDGKMPSDNDVKIIRNIMRETCANECPKIWSEEYPGRIDSEIDDFYNEYLANEDLMFHGFNEDLDSTTDKLDENISYNQINNTQLCLPFLAADGGDAKCQTKSDWDVPF